MDIDSIKSATMQALGHSDASLVDYITEDLVSFYESSSKEDSKASGDTDPALREHMDSVGLLGYGTYGNSLVFKPGIVYYKAGPRGSANYGCGTDAWTWRADPGDTYSPTGRNCPNGAAEYLLNCPSCI